MTKAEVEKQITVVRLFAWKIVKSEITRVCKRDGLTFQSNGLWPDRYEVRDENKSFLEQRVKNKEIDEIVRWHVSTMYNFYDCHYGKDGKWFGGPSV